MAEAAAAAAAAPPPPPAAAVFFFLFSTKGPFQGYTPPLEGNIHSIGMCRMQRFLPVLMSCFMPVE
jgi:hypothetical protein